MRVGIGEMVLSQMCPQIWKHSWFGATVVVTLIPSDHLNTVILHCRAAAMLVCNKTQNRWHLEPSFKDQL